MCAHVIPWSDVVGGVGDDGGGGDGDGNDTAALVFVVVVLFLLFYGGLHLVVVQDYWHW